MIDTERINDFLDEKREQLGNLVDSAVDALKEGVMGKSVNAGIIGATGYAGIELVRILCGHPYVKLAAVSSVSYEGKKLSEVYPALYQICDMVLTGEDDVIEKSDVVFASLPHGLCEKIAKKCAEQDKLLIDLGADFRLQDEADYKEWYGLEYTEPELHQKAVYCIPELHRDRVTADVDVIANPGCYPTSIGLALAPAIRAGLIGLSGIVIDSKSGATGAGRGLALNTHYTECNEAFGPYKVAAHRHTPEIEQTLSELSGEAVKVTFVPHLLPVNRGIVSTIYATLQPGVTAADVRRVYGECYHKEKFVRVLPEGQTANLKNIKCSNYCDISLHVDERTGRLILVSTIDNMVKGAAGQAVQNMNLYFRFPETAGLEMVPPAI